MIMSILKIFSVYTLLSAQFMLLAKLWMRRNCTGISGKTQQLFAIVFLARNLDLFSSHNALTFDHYVLKISFIVVSYFLVISIFFFHWETYQTRYDTFRIELLIIPCLILAFEENYGFDFLEIFWAFSLYLESIAIIPQVYFCCRANRIEGIVYRYVGLLLIYKIIHLADIIHVHLYLDKVYVDRLSLSTGVLQFLFYCDFFLTETAKMIDETNEIDEEVASGEIKAKEDRNKEYLKGNVFTISNEKVNIVHKV